MWLLMLLILNTDIEMEAFINAYATLEACEAERVRVTREMDHAYPNVKDRDYKLVCHERNNPHRRT